MNDSLVSKFENIAGVCRAFLARPAVAFIVVCTVTLFTVLRGFDADPDLFARISVGKLFVDSGFQTQDPFAFSPRKPIWVDHEWLAGVFFYYTAQIGGDSGLLLLKLLAVVATLYFLYGAASRLNSPWIALLTCSFAGVQSSYLWATTVRSQIFTYFFLAYLLCAIARHLKSGRFFYFIPVPFSMLVWSQTHGGFVVGLGFTCIFALWVFVTAPQHRLTAVFLAGSTIFAALISPYGPAAYWSYIIEAVTMPRPTITEWAPVDPFSILGLGMHLLSLLCILGFVRHKKNSSDILCAILLVLACYQAYSHQRFVGIFCFVAAALGSQYQAVAMGSLLSTARSVRLQWATAVALVAIVPVCLLSIIFSLKEFSRLSYDDYPVQAMDWLSENNARGRLLVDFNNGSFAIWRGYPALTVALDGRYEELYPEATMTLVTTAFQPRATGFTTALQSLNPDFILLDRRLHTEKNLYPAQWKEVYADSTFSILSKATRDFHRASRSLEAIVGQMWIRKVRFVPAKS